MAPYGYTYPPQPYPMPSFEPAVAWAPPFGPMAQGWQPPVPFFARQYGWRPAEQPWLVADDRVHESTPYQRAAASPMVGFPSANRYAPAYGGWRPMPQPIVTGQYAARGPQPNVAQYSVRQATGSRAVRAGDRRVAAFGPAPVSAGRGYWRPQPVTPQASWRGSPTAFRPVSYGQSAPYAERMASHSVRATNTVQERLPGWVTTYQEPDAALSCSWCGGS